MVYDDGKGESNGGGESNMDNYGYGLTWVVRTQGEWGDLGEGANTLGSSSGSVWLYVS